MFRKKDVELLLRIRHLLYERKFTIDGARRFLAEQGGVNSGSEVSLSAQQELFPDANPLSEIRKEVAEILRMVSDG
jgi:DNA-binding transcriptional MerR regulator